jgi:hypothetical protein
MRKCYPRRSGFQYPGQDPARYPSYYPANTSLSIQGFDKTDLKTQEVDEYM